MSITTKPSLQDNDALLTYRVGPVLCCGPTLPIITITPPPSLTHLPGTSTAEPGIFKHGKYIVSATDLRFRFGVKQENWKQPGQVIIAQHGDQTRGYFVDEIKDVIHFPETGWGQLPSYLPRGIFTRTLLLNEQIYLYTEFEKLSQLQGSGYLAEYISRLEEIKQSEENKQSKGIKPTENTKANSKNNLDTKPADKKTITSSTIAGATIKNKHHIENGLDNKNIASSTSNYQAVDTSKSNTPLEPDDNVIPENSTQSNTENKGTSNKSASNKGTAIKEVVKTEFSSADKNKPEKIKAETISANKIKHDKPASTSSSIENKTPLTGLKAYSQEKITTNFTDSKTETEQSKLQNIMPASDTSLSKIQKSIPNKYSEDAQPIKTNGSYLGLIIIFLILLMAAGGGYYYISAITTENNIITQSVNDVDTATSTTKSTTALKDAPLLIVEAKESEPNEINLAAPLTSESKPADTNNIHSTPSLNQDPVSGTYNANISSANIKDDEYHASIKQEHGTITIELDGPLPPAIKNLDNSAQDLNNISNELNTITTNTLTIIAKRDTLWAIASQYLLNPCRYPALAKLSKIRNPDLIYPGNRVRIIYKNNANK